MGPNDLLNDTPILDIKPYHPESDFIDNTKIGWLEINSESASKKYDIKFSPFSSEQIDFLNSNGLSELQIFILRQLEYDPTNSDKKRVVESSGFWTLSYRTWRVDFIVTENMVSVVGIRSAELHQRRRLPGS